MIHFLSAFSDFNLEAKTTELLNEQNLEDGQETNPIPASSSLDLQETNALPEAIPIEPSPESDD